MKNPFYNRKFANSYFMVWIIVIIIQSLLLNSVFEIKYWVALTDSIISNVIFALLGFGIWYVVRYNFSNKNPFQTIIVFLMAGIAVVTVWFGFSMMLKNIIIKIIGYNPGFVFRVIYQVSTGVFLYIILVLIFQIFILMNKYSEKLKVEENLTRKLEEAQLNMLKAYINPHFLFNSLNSVNALIGKENEKARNLLVDLSDYFRYIVKNRENELVNFKDELDSALTYFRIEQERYGDRIIFEEQIEPECYNCKIPVMILQPLMENIIKHAVSESISSVHVLMKSYISDDNLIIMIRNTTEGFENKEKGTGMGISSTYDRLFYLYGRKDLVKINQKDNYFEILLSIPLKK